MPLSKKNVSMQIALKSYLIKYEILLHLTRTFGGYKEKTKAKVTIRNVYSDVRKPKYWHK